VAPEVINGYTLTTKFHSAGGGQCQWAFAEKGGQAFFIKRFLQPTYPLPDGPGSAATKARKKAACEAFERRHKDMMQAVSRLSKGGGVIVARDFFREGAKYYKVTEKVDVSTDSAVSARPFAERILLMAVVCHSLAVLHRAGIVHGDLKPANVLLKRTAKDVLTAKLIDFDDAYMSGAPPAADVLVGDFVYYSPETHLYILGEGQAEELERASDVFALGILFTEYMTGSRPSTKGGSDTCAVAVLRGEELTTGIGEIDGELSDIVHQMLSRSPADRPQVNEVLARLKQIRKRDPQPRVAKLPEPPSRLRGKILERKPEPPHPSPVPKTRAVSSDSSRLRGSLVKRGRSST